MSVIYHHVLINKQTWGVLVTVNINKGRNHSQFSKHLQTKIHHACLIANIKMALKPNIENEYAKYQIFGGDYRIHAKTWGPHFYSNLRSSLSLLHHKCAHIVAQELPNHLYLLIYVKIRQNCCLSRQVLNAFNYSLNLPEKLLNEYVFVSLSIIPNANQPIFPVCIETETITN